MLSSLVTYLKFGNRYCGIEHAIANDQSLYRVIILKKIKGKLELEVTHELKDFNDIKDHLSKNQHILIVFNNSQVLTKEINHLTNESNIQANVHKAFPNIDLSEFYYEIVKSSNKNYISIIRKAHAQETIKDYSKLGLNVINFSLGINALSHLIDIVEYEKLTTSTNEILIENNKISEVKFNSLIKQQDYNINGLNISNFFLLPFSICLNFILGRNSTVQNIAEDKSTLVKGFLSKRYYAVGLKAGLLFIFLILLVNFFVFNHYFNNNQELQNLVDVNISSKETVLKMQEEITTKQTLVENLSRNNNSNSSYYINRFMLELPNSINLTSLNYQPLLKKIKKGKTIQLQSNAIRVQGITKSSEDFSKWIDALQQQKWVNSLEVTHYSDHTRTSSEFTILVQIQNG